MMHYKGIATKKSGKKDQARKWVGYARRQPC